MYLLNEDLIRAYVQDNSKSYLYIDSFAEECLQHTSYYFRLDRVCKLVDKQGQTIMELGLQRTKLVIPAGGRVMIRSLETFMLSNKVMAIFGQVSDLSEAGLQLLHSPFIDPTFFGQLELGLVNHSDGDVVLKWKQAIGKVCFFDVSDTYPLSPPKKGKAMARKFEDRHPNRDDDPVPYHPDGRQH